MYLRKSAIAEQAADNPTDLLPRMSQLENHEIEQKSDWTELCQGECPDRSGKLLHGQLYVFGIILSTLGYDAFFNYYCVSIMMVSTNLPFFFFFLSQNPLSIFFALGRTVSTRHKAEDHEPTTRYFYVYNWMSLGNHLLVLENVTFSCSLVYNWQQCPVIQQAAYIHQREAEMSKRQ